MGKRLTVTTLAREAGVSSKAIRYWEGLGLLPRASRTHTGYRVFPPEAEGYVRFIRKSKAIGLSLREMREVLRLARAGRCPCDEVVHWTEARIREIESEIRLLSETLGRLKRATREWRETAVCAPEECGEVCTLIEHLPEFQSFAGTKAKSRSLTAIRKKRGWVRDDILTRRGDRAGGKTDEQMVEVRANNDACCGAAGTAGAGANGSDLLSEVPALPVPLRGKRRGR